MRIGIGIGLNLSRKRGGAAIAPSNTVAPVISGSTTLGSTLSSTTGTWTGTAPITYAYQWRRNGSDIIGATSSTYVITISDSLANITCRVTATNAGGSSSATSNTITLPSYAPVNTVAPVISGTAVVGQTLSSTTGTWTNSPTSFSYQWKRGATNIGTNSPNYTLVQADAGNTSNITCVVTATNAGGSANATSNTIAQILTIRTNAFIISSGISDATIRGALNTLDIGMIANSLDTKMKALYPFVGGTASTHKWNFMDSRDLDVAFRLVFNGGWTHSNTGALPNGSNAYAETYLSPSIVINDNNDGHLSYYSRTNNTGINAIEIGCGDSTTSFDMVIKFGGGNLAGACINMYDINVFTNNARSDGYYVASQNNINNIRDLYRNGTSLATQNISQNVTPPSNYTIYIGARNGVFAGTPQFYTNRECALASIGNGLSASETTILNTLVTNFQTTLGRNV